MSTDIHICVEVREGGVWQAIRRPRRTYGNRPGQSKEQLTGWLWNDQNYDIFAILADVRNRTFFAGTEDRIVPISEPRGLPDDVSAEVSEACGYFGDEAHSRSWVTLEELLNYDWEQAAKLEVVRDFLDRVVPVLGELGDPHDVRLVFWFDN